MLVHQQIYYITLHSIWSTTASSSQTLVNADCDLWTSTLVLFHIHKHTLATPQLWNSLPVEMCQPHVEIRQCRQLLKTFQFGWDCGA